MSPREFFYLVAQMRSAQSAYFKTRQQNVFRAARKLEDDVDREIERVRQVLARREQETNGHDSQPTDGLSDG